MEEVISGTKSGPENEFKGVGSQKVDFYLLGKKSIFQLKAEHLFKLNTWYNFLNHFNDYKNWAPFSHHF